jgi:hypothetical protein
LTLICSTQILQTVFQILESHITHSFLIM